MVDVQGVQSSGCQYAAPHGALDFHLGQANGACVIVVPDVPNHFREPAQLPHVADGVRQGGVIQVIVRHVQDVLAEVMHHHVSMCVMVISGGHHWLSIRVGDAYHCPFRQHHHQGFGGVIEGALLVVELDDLE